MIGRFVYLLASFVRRYMEYLRTRVHRMIQEQKHSWNCVFYIQHITNKIDGRGLPF